MRIPYKASRLPKIPVLKNRLSYEGIIPIYRRCKLCGQISKRYNVIRGTRHVICRTCSIKTHVVLLSIIALGTFFFWRHL